MSSDAAAGGVVRPFSDLQDAGLLWLINRVVFYPRGWAFGLVRQEGEIVGWQLLGDGREPWRYAGDERDLFDRAQRTLAPSVGSDGAESVLSEESVVDAERHAMEPVTDAAGSWSAPDPAGQLYVCGEAELADDQPLVLEPQMLDLINRMAGREPGQATDPRADGPRGGSR